MKITYRHYRVPVANWKRKGDPPKKGDPPNLARYMRGVTKWTPHGRGGRTFCTILDDNEKVLTSGGVTCFMEDHFCYQEGRERALQNALENMAEEMAEKRGEDAMSMFIKGFKDEAVPALSFWIKIKKLFDDHFPDSEADSRRILEKSFERAFADQDWLDWREPVQRTIKTDAEIANDGDAQKRKNLLIMLWKDYEADRHLAYGVAPRPFPPMTDDQVRGELRRILG